VSAGRRENTSALLSVSARKSARSESARSMVWMGGMLGVFWVRVVLWCWCLSALVMGLQRGGCGSVSGGGEEDRGVGGDEVGAWLGG
jgi:hypothetical protein